MRKISQWQDFSYRHPANCYFTISEEGVPVQIWNTLSEMERIYQSVKNGETDLYVAVPGETTTDIFHIDDIELLGREYGFCEGHQHVFDWEISDSGNKTDRYASVKINFHCGCCVSLRTIRQLAKDLKKQMGWDVQVGSCGYNTIYVKKKSLRDLV